jgi:SAM-dependent methyltransferase
MNGMHEANRRRWDLAACWWQARRAHDWRRCHLDPALGFERGSLALLKRYAGDLSGKRACVLGSGDNYAVFALCGLGATVTSVDISQAQLDIAAGRAAQLGLQIRFVRGDVTDLAALRSAGLEDGGFDVVCSTNGVMVWIADLARYHAQVHRLLRPGGVWLGYDIHPMQRPWRNVPGALQMARPYVDSGPRAYLYDPVRDETVGLAADAPVGEAGGLALSYKCAWTLGELVNALLDSGLELVHMAEEAEDDPRFWDPAVKDGRSACALVDWRTNPRAGLPVWLTLVARKRIA